MSTEDSKPIVQPKITRGLSHGTPKYQGGSRRSVAVLKENRFDPITSLVNRYREMENEVAFWKGIRDRSVIQVINAEGKERYYDADAHMAAEKMLIEIGDKLLRYGYGRVPETVNVNDNRLPTMVVQLSTKSDHQHFINKQDVIEHDEGDDE